MRPTVTVDVGTTRLKLGLFDALGRQQASEKHATPTVRDESGEVYDIEALVALLEGFIRGLDAQDRQTVEKVAIAGVGESGGLVRQDLSLASPMIVWHDHRGAGLLDQFDARDREAVYRVTGLPVNANYALSKVAWALARAGGRAAEARWLNVSEYLAARLTGQRWAEYSLASRTMALDLRRVDWSVEICSLAGIDTSVFPDLRAAAHGVPIAEAAAGRLELPRSVEVHVVGHDHMVGAVGAGLRPGELLNSTGTTEGLLQLRDEPVLDPEAAASKLANGIACDTSTFTVFASIPTGGSAFETLQRMLGMSAADLSRSVASLAARYLAGELDLAQMPLVIPHFRGSPPPEKSAAARGVIANVSSGTTAEDIVFGTFLGMAVEFRRVLALFHTEPTAVKVIGPAARNPLWLHLKADILGLDLSVSDVAEVVSAGAQALASGEPGSWEACAPRTVEADSRRHRALAEWQEDVRPVVQRMVVTPR